MVKIKASPVNLVVIQVYMPTTNSRDEKVEEFYDQVGELFGVISKNDNVIIMGDFNASVGTNKIGRIFGKFGLGTTNRRGERLIEFCTQHEMVVTNTFFNVPLRRWYTWKAPADSGRYQIDYILVKRRYRNQIK